MHTFTNDLAQWTYHVPQGWQAYGVCGAARRVHALSTTPRWATGQVDKADEIRFRPADEPTVGGYSLRVRILDNTFVDVHQTVATKIVGFRDSSEVADFNIIDRTQRSVYFDYRDKTSDYHRFNFFQWFAVPGPDQRDPGDVGVRPQGRRTGPAGAVRPVRRQRRGRARRRPPK